MTKMTASAMPSLQNGNYRPCVGIMVVNREGDVFVGQRLDMKSDYWQMPQGGIEMGEAPMQAMHRELKEETGLSEVTLLSEASDWLDYDLPDNLKGRLWGGRYVGQSQKWFLCGFCGEDDEIDLGSGSSAEFGCWKWQSLMNVVEEAVPFKRNVYRLVVKTFSSRIKTWTSSFYENLTSGKDR